MNLTQLLLYIKICAFGYWRTLLSHMWIWIHEVAMYFENYIPNSWISPEFRQNNKTYFIHDAQLQMSTIDSHIHLRDITYSVRLFMKFNSIHLIDDLQKCYPEWFRPNFQIIIRFYDETETDIQNIKLLKIQADTCKYYLTGMDQKDLADFELGEILFDP